MELSLFNSFINTAEFNGVLFYYKGVLSQNVISTIGESMKNRLDGEELSSPVKQRKLFSSFIEMAQNAMFYAPETPNHEKEAAFVVGVEGQKFYIACGNYIESKYADRIRSKIDPLLTMTIDEVKAAYKTQLRNERHEIEDQVSHGAGLGLLTIAKDSSEPIEYKIAECGSSHGRLQSDEPMSMFYLKAII